MKSEQSAKFFQFFRKSGVEIQLVGKKKEKKH